MNEDPIVVEITFTPLRERWSDARNGVFIFAIPDLIIVRHGFFASRQRKGPRKGKDFLREQISRSNFDWNHWVDQNEEMTLAALLEMGLGRVRCKVCDAEYANTDLILWDWAEQNNGGQQYTCPKEHPLFTLQTYWGEFIGDDKCLPVRVRHMPGTTVADVFNNR